MNIRFASMKDKSYVLALMDELGEEINMKRGFSPHNAEASMVGGMMFEDVVSRKDTMIFVADHDGALVGLITFYLLPNIRHGFYGGHIEDVVVSKPHRRKGVGTLLFTAVKAYCKEHNIRVIKLDSGLELVDAHKFYEKHGGIFTEKMFRFDL
ncbi:MAG: GNAT family N-acetyltransferase [Patescibacteria group bacterium]